MEMKFKNVYSFGDLQDGDRFYFAGDKKQLVYEFRRIITDYNKFELRANGTQHFIPATGKQRSSDVVFLRHAGTVC